MQTKPKTYPMCTIANAPRLPEHCIIWASQINWPLVHGDQELNPDDPMHIQELLDASLGRANEFGISGITLSLTLGVVKNIIPAIASTNAIIAGIFF